MKIVEVLIESDMEQLAYWLEKWILETAPKRVIERHLLEFDTWLYQKSNHPIVYREIQVRSIPREPTVEILKGGMLEAWTADYEYAAYYASLYPRGIILKSPTTKLTVFLDTDAFNAVHPIQHHQKGEVIVFHQPGRFEFDLV